MAFSFRDFFEYLNDLILSQTWGLSDASYPQTVQYFIFAAFPNSLFKFLVIFLACLGTLGVFMLFRARKREMGKPFSELSFFLRMDLSRIEKQALFAALPGQAFFWSAFSPAAFFALLFAEGSLGINGLGMLVKTAFLRNDMPLLYGSLFCGLSFMIALFLFFLSLRVVLPRK